MLLSTGVLRKSRWGGVGIVVLVIAVSTPFAPRAQAPGSITGTVTDARKAPLPGVKVTVMTATLERAAVTDPDGRYELPNLPPGTYTAKAALPGFETAVEHNVVVDTGATTPLHFALKMGCLEEVVRVDMGFAEALKETGAVVQIRILDSGPGKTCDATRFCVCAEHVADVIRVLKASQQETSPAAIRFLQEGAAFDAESGRARTEKAYAPGQEYVAFLQWNSAADRFVRFNGPNYMFPIHEGRVQFRRTDTPGLSDGMPVEDFARALRKMVTGGPL